MAPIQIEQVQAFNVQHDHGVSVRNNCRGAPELARPFTSTAETPQQGSRLADAMNLRAPTIQHEPDASVKYGVGDREHLAVQPRPGRSSRQHVFGCLRAAGCWPGVDTIPGNLEDAPNEYRPCHSACDHRQPSAQPLAGCFRVRRHRSEGAVWASAPWPRDSDSAALIGKLRGVGRVVSRSRDTILNAPDGRVHVNLGQIFPGASAPPHPAAQGVPLQPLQHSQDVLVGRTRLCKSTSTKRYRTTPSRSRARPRRPWKCGRSFSAFPRGRPPKPRRFPSASSSSGRRALGSPS